MRVEFLCIFVLMTIVLGDDEIVTCGSGLFILLVISSLLLYAFQQ